MMEQELHTNQQINNNNSNNMSQDELAIERVI